MSEANILNPAAGNLMNPDYTIPITDPDIMAMWQARSGKAFNRDMLARGRVFELHWDKADFTTYRALRQWSAQYRRDFFSYFDIEDNRYYSGRFAEGSFKHERNENNQVNVSATFVEIPGLPMFQYPSNWGVDSVFVEERDGFGGDLVKLTGTWDHRDVNYALQSAALGTAPWVTSGTPPTLTQNAGADPFGGNTADQISFPAKAANTECGVVQNISGLVVPGRQFTYSIWLRVTSGTATVELISQDNPFAGGGFSGTANITTVWQRFSFAGTMPANSNNGIQIQIRAPFAPATAAFAVLAVGAQLEPGAAATTYTPTTTAAVRLAAPNSDASLHGGFAYWNIGTDATAAAEWLYFGYGFRVWAPKGSTFGIMQVFLDGVSLATVDLYSAAAVSSAAIFTQQNTSLGLHRVKLSPTNTKNAASSNFIVAADAIEVMQ